ncbi:MAG: hypothetical protein MJE68_12915 [Proteobacteria bacterium]|nr:hypothetical protein [Pseudomonadota bacterium]
MVEATEQHKPYVSSLFPHRHGLARFRYLMNPNSHRLSFFFPALTLTADEDSLSCFNQFKRKAALIR